MIYKNNINSIKINNIEGNIKLELIKENVIEVICDNTEIPIKEEQNCIYIGENNCYNFSSNKKGFFSGRDIDININSSNCVIINGEVISKNNSNSKEMPKGNVNIKVPFNCIQDIDLSIIGRANIENISSKLKIDTSCSIDLELEGLDYVLLDSSGQSKGTINNVETLELDASGQSNFKILNVHKLSIDGSGQTNICVESDIIKRTEVDVSGQSIISLKAKEVKRLTAELSGMSNLFVIGRIEKKTIEKSGMSKFIYSEK